jgi:hypothetical protein
MSRSKTTDETPEQPQQNAGFNAEEDEAAEETPEAPQPATWNPRSQQG